MQINKVNEEGLGREKLDCRDIDLNMFEQELEEEMYSSGQTRTPESKMEVHGQLEIAHGSAGSSAESVDTKTTTDPGHSAKICANCADLKKGNYARVVNIHCTQDYFSTVISSSGSAAGQSNRLSIITAARRLACQIPSVTGELSSH